MRIPHAHDGHGTTPVQEPVDRHAALRADLARRLARVCRDMPACRFEALVDAICERKVRWERRLREPPARC